MNAEIEAAYALLAAGDLAGAEARLEVALREPSLTASDRAQAFARLSDGYRRAGLRADALRTARDASVISVVADSDHVRAYADFMLGSAALEVYFHDHAAAELLHEGTEALARAHALYTQLGAHDVVAYIDALRAPLSTAP